MPVIILNNSPEIWSGVPIPADAILILPRLALAYAMNSGTVLAGNDGLTTMTSGERPMLAGGMGSLTKTCLGRKAMLGRWQLSIGIAISAAVIATASNADETNLTVV